MEKNFTSSLDREKNEPLSIGRSETQKFTRNNNSPTMVTLLSSHHDTKGSLEQDITLGKVAGYRWQGKPQMRWLDTIKEATGLQLDVLKETVQDRKKWRMHKCEMASGEGKPLLNIHFCLENPLQDHQESQQTRRTNRIQYNTIHSMLACVIF